VPKLCGFVDISIVIVVSHLTINNRHEVTYINPGISLCAAGRGKCAECYLQCVKDILHVYAGFITSQMFAGRHHHRHPNQPSLYGICDAVADDHIHRQQARQDCHDMYRDDGRVWFNNHCDCDNNHQSFLYRKTHYRDLVSELHPSKSPSTRDKANPSWASAALSSEPF
jgi:hypothetical protein